MNKNPTIAELKARIVELRLTLDNLLKRSPVALQPLVRRQADKVVAEMASLGHPVTIFQGFRSKAEQDHLYAQGRTRPGAIVTNAKGGYSNHNYGVAVDVVFVVNSRPSWAEHHPWPLLGKTGKKYGFSWGGDWQGFVDRPHLEMTFGYSLNDFINNKVDYIKYV